MAKRSAINYENTRGLLLVVGLVSLGIVALVMFVRRVDPVEVIATLMFLPIFLSFLYWGTRGAVLAAVTASAVYLVLRLPAIQAVGFGPFAGLFVTRTLGYLGFGAVGGWASEQLKTNLLKLDLYDTIDDMSGLTNARSIVDTIDLEKSRSTRYEKIFSVVVASMTLPELPRRKTGGVLRAIGTVMRASARNVDHAGHGWDLDQDRFAIILPETGQSGAQTFAAKLGPLVESSLVEQGLTVSDLLIETATFPDEPEKLDAIVATFRRIQDRLFPESADSST